MKTIPALLFIALAAPAAAAPVTWSCTFTQRCSDASCGPDNVTYSFRLDTATGQGEMLASGSSYPGTVSTGGDLTHFLMVNDAGAELTSITSTGVVSYYGQMSGSPSLLTYRLTGLCSRGGKG